MRIEVERTMGDGDVVRLAEDDVSPSAASDRVNALCDVLDELMGDDVDESTTEEPEAAQVPVGWAVFLVGLVLALFVWLADPAAGAECPEGCIPASPTRTATTTRTIPNTRTPTATRTATRTRTSTRTRVPTRTPTTKATPWATPSARLTATVASTRTPTSRPAPTAAAVVDSRSVYQSGAGPGGNSYRPDLTIDPFKLERRATWKAPRGQALGRMFLVGTAQGIRVVAQYGEAGFIDSPWVTPATDHQCRTTSALMTLDLVTLSTAACGSPWSATFEGMWPAFWPHPTLRGYTRGRQHDGGPNGFSINAAGQISISLIGGYREEVGKVKVSEALDLLVTQNPRCWHGGSCSFVQGESLKDPSRKVSFFRGPCWNVENQECNSFAEGGIAIAEQTAAVVATLNFLGREREAHKGLYVYDARTGDQRCAETGGSWSAPSVGPEGRFAYAVREGLQLVRMDTLTCEVETEWTASGIVNSQWTQPPTVTDTHVILVEPSQNPRADDRPQGDLYAYRTTADDLWFEWTVDAGIMSPVDLLSGFSRTDVFPMQADSETLFFAGRDALRAVRHRDGAVLPWMQTSELAPEGFSDPILYEGGIVARNAFRWRNWPECQREQCPDGKPVGGVDYGRCCRGVTRRCEYTDCAKCEQAYGYCANDPERFRVESPGTAIEVWETRP